MSQTCEKSILDRMLDPLCRCLDDESARRIVALTIDPLVQARVDFLAEGANEGRLTDEELAEYDAYINVDDIIATLKLKARDQLEAKGRNGDS